MKIDMSESFRLPKIFGISKWNLKTKPFLGGIRPPAQVFKLAVYSSKFWLSWFNQTPAKFAPKTQKSWERNRRFPRNTWAQKILWINFFCDKFLPLVLRSARKFFWYFEVNEKQVKTARFSIIFDHVTRTRSQSPSPKFPSCFRKKPSKICCIFQINFFRRYFIFHNTSRKHWWVTLEMLGNDWQTTSA